MNSKVSPNQKQKRRTMKNGFLWSQMTSLKSLIRNCWTKKSKAEGKNYRTSSSCIHSSGIVLSLNATMNAWTTNGHMESQELLILGSANRNCLVPSSTLNPKSLKSSNRPKIGSLSSVVHHRASSSINLSPLTVNSTSAKSIESRWMRKRFQGCSLIKSLTISTIGSPIMMRSPNCWSISAGKLKNCWSSRSART